MIVRKTEGEVTSIFSDREGMCVMQVETGRKYSVAEETEGGPHYHYEEVGKAE